MNESAARSAESVEQFRPYQAAPKVGGPASSSLEVWQLQGRWITTSPEMGRVMYHSSHISVQEVD